MYIIKFHFTFLGKRLLTKGSFCSLFFSPDKRTNDSVSATGVYFAWLCVPTYGRLFCYLKKLQFKRNALDLH